MMVPLVAAFSACSSTYGRLAPTPPVAAAMAGLAARATRPQAMSAATVIAVPVLVLLLTLLSVGNIRCSLSPRWTGDVVRSVAAPLRRNRVMPAISGRILRKKRWSRPGCGWRRHADGRAVVAGDRVG